ncbi:MAG: hypothetical protein HY040_16580 [Planctomycetes bacterium]|nr:hypothetical protein [Planctomycetota bacterium]
MFENRFRDLQPQDDPARNHTSSAFAFFPLTYGSQPYGNSMMDQGLSWIYQRAFESARDAALASRRRDLLFASLN